MEPKRDEGKFNQAYSRAEYDELLAEARDVFDERNARYQDLFRQADPLDLLTQIRHKADRCARLYTLGTDHHDDLLDLINYAVFYGINEATGGR